MSNVTLTDQKRRLYDEVAALTFNDPEFKKINERLGLTEKELRKAKLHGLLKFREFKENPIRTTLSQARAGRRLKVQRSEYTI